ncbi:MAG: glycosyltransferase family 2 protein [Proteobacteria bacterium]|nr:glycosyltransferase family 2 protein [Pseudomonadota bacterium]
MYPSETRIAVLIPCYNEEITIGKVIDDFRKELPAADIYVFDNNSTDKSAQIAKEKDAIVVKEPKQGKGFVVVSMFQKVEADIYVMVDGDDTYPAESVHDLIKPVLNQDADMTVGTRLSKYKSKAFKPLNLMGNFLVAALVNWIFDNKLKDIMSGYRVFNRDFVKNIPLDSRGFEVETQLVIQSLYYQYKTLEVEIELRQRPEGSTSKLNTISDGIRVLLTIANIAKAYRPLFFFGTLGILFLLTGFGLGLIPIIEFFQTGLVTHFPTAILATGLVLVSTIFFAIGLILDSINFRMREIIQIIRKH